MAQLINSGAAAWCDCAWPSREPNAYTCRRYRAATSGIPAV